MNTDLSVCTKKPNSWNIAESGVKHHKSNQIKSTNSWSSDCCYL